MFFPVPSNSTLQAAAKANLDAQSNDDRSPQTQTRRGNFFNVTPIRDHESKSGQNVNGDDPQLLGPGNHTAGNDPRSQGRALIVVPIQWESIQRIDSKPNVPPRPKTTPRTAPRPAQQNWDDGGWHSAW